MQPEFYQSSLLRASVTSWIRDKLRRQQATALFLLRSILVTTDIIVIYKNITCEMIFALFYLK